MSHIFTVLSSLAEMRRALSELKASPRTRAVCPRRVATFRPETASQTAIDPARFPDATNLPSGLSDTAPRDGPLRKRTRSVGRQAQRRTRFRVVATVFVAETAITLRCLMTPHVEKRRCGTAPKTFSSSPSDTSQMRMVSSAPVDRMREPSAVKATLWT